jgi:hypothetical protein
MEEKSDVNVSPSKPESAKVVEAPTVTFEKLTFSDGTVIALDEADIVVLVGPNNAGKSVALRELENHIGPPVTQTVITSVSLRHTGTGKQLVDYLEQKTPKRADNKSFLGFRFTLQPERIEGWFPNRLDALRPLFCQRVATETRITDSNPVGAISILDDNPSHPIQLMFSDASTEQRMSQYFQRAFNQELVVFRVGGNSWPLLVGKKPELNPGEREFAASYNERLRASTIPL